jgi:glycosyltransferase involved in cell wall biosynthesis
VNLRRAASRNAGRGVRAAHDGRVPQPVTFLVNDSSGHGGVARTVVNLVNHLADHRDVHLVSLHRGADRPAYPLDPRVGHEVLLDVRPGRLGPARRLLDRRPSRLDPPTVERRMTRLTDHVLRRRLSRQQPGVLVTTRPSLHLAAARWRADGVRLVGQDHQNFPTRFRGPAQAAVLRTALPALDAFVVLTEADAADYRRELPDAPDVRVIRNALPWPVPGTPASLGTKVVVAAGRLVREKGFGRLLDAFAPVARAHPDWQLHVYGDGPLRPALTARVDRLGLAGQIRLPGYADDLVGVLAGASVFAMTSRTEGFPMVLIEAMSAGVPLVSFDCPRGPGEIVDHGRNGLLVGDGDVPAFTAALARLVEDDALRRRCGARARQDAHRYAADRVVRDWLDLLEELDA